MEKPITELKDKHYIAIGFMMFKLAIVSVLIGLLIGYFLFTP